MFAKFWKNKQIRVYTYTYSLALRCKDIPSVFGTVHANDVTKIESYVHNGSPVCLLRPKRTKKNTTHEIPCANPSCRTRLARADVFCSIQCYLVCNTDGQSGTPYGATVQTTVNATVDATVHDGTPTRKRDHPTLDEFIVIDDYSGTHTSVHTSVHTPVNTSSTRTPIWTSRRKNANPSPSPSV